MPDGRATEHASGSRPPRVVALVPAKDRADTVGATVSALLDIDTVARVLVVDDGSTDGTAAVARNAGADVLALGENVGKGDAVAAGVAATPDVDIYLLIDADVGAYATEARELLRPILDGAADLVVGVLPSAGSRGGFGNVRRLARSGIARACGYEATAPLSGQRAVRAEHLRRLTSAGRFGLEVAMTIDAVRSGARVTEVDVAMEHRHTGRTASGFGHRGAQGLDILGALWPRVASPRVRRGLLGVVLVGLLLGSYLTATAARPTSVALESSPERVVLMGITHLDLADVTAESMPNLYRLSVEGAFGMLTPRTGGSRSAAAGYATLGAGDQVRAASTSGFAAAPDTAVEGDTAASVLLRRSGVVPDGSVILPSMPATIAAAGTHVRSGPGALGDALHAAGRETAVVSNAGTIDGAGILRRAAPAALAVVDGLGAVDHGEVGPGLLQQALTSPFGIEADPDSFLTAVSDSLDVADVVVVDTGETDRAVAYAPWVSEPLREQSRREALRRTDEILGGVAELVDDDTLLIVAGVNAPPGGRLVPLVTHGPGVASNRVTSPSTRRPDLVTLTDLAPTVLAALGVERPPEMIGQPIRYQPGTVDRADLVRQDDLIGARDEVYGSLVRTFVVTVAIVYLVAAATLLRRGAHKLELGAVRAAVLVTASWPVSTFVIRALPPLYGLGGVSHLLVWVIAAVIAGIADRWRRHPLDPLLAIAAFTTLVLCVDLALGARLQVSSYLGYTPTVAARFVGLGNPPLGVLAGAAVLTCALLVARSRRPADTWWVAAGVALLVLVATGAPWLGSSVGGTLSLVPALGLLLYLLANRAISWRTVIGLGIAAVAVLAIAVGLEALRPPDERTHIGRFFLGAGDVTSAWTTVARKWEVNVRLLTASTWSWLIPILGGFATVMLVGGQGWRRLRDAPAEQAAIIALALAAFLGWAVNDSGPLVAALALVYLGPLVVLLFLRGEAIEPELLPATTASGSEPGAGTGPGVAAGARTEERP